MVAQYRENALRQRDMSRSGDSPFSIDSEANQDLASNDLVFWRRQAGLFHQGRHFQRAAAPRLDDAATIERLCDE